ncbi:uncharacterized protein V6R79_016833 [Siganus canaliculatus]
MITTVVLPAALLLLLLPGTLTQDTKTIPFEVVVKNSVLNTSNETFKVTAVYRAILLSGLTRLMNSNAGFSFAYSDDPNYGPYLESVNGVAGSDKDHTYWELLVKDSSGTITRPDVGIGCYIPSENEQIILNFTRW